MTEATQEAILPASERTRTVEVISRKVATDVEGNAKEFETAAKVFVRPLPFRRWSKALNHISHLVQFIPTDGINLNDPLELAMLATNLIGLADEDLFAIIELATDRAPEFFDTLDADDGLKVVLAIVEVNKGFFVQKVLPLISEHLPAVKENLAGTLGQTE